MVWVPCIEIDRHSISMVPCRCLQGKTYSSSVHVDLLFSVLAREIMGKFDVILIHLISTI